MNNHSVKRRTVMLSVKSIFLTIIKVSILVCFANAQSSGGLGQVDEFGTNPGNLKMFLYVSEKSKASLQKVPLVIILHGCGQSAKQIANVTGWNKIADSAGCIIVYPEQRIQNNMGRCFNWFSTKDIEFGKGECQSIFEMIQYTSTNFHIDTSRIFIAGYSAGAAMATVMMVTQPQLFKCAGIYAGGAYKIATNPISAMKAMAGNLNITSGELRNVVRQQRPDYVGPYPKIIIFQGLKDHTVDPKNALILNAQFAAINKVDTVPDQIFKNYLGYKNIDRYDYHDSVGWCFSSLYFIENVGHKIIKNGDENFWGDRSKSNDEFDAIIENAKQFGIL